MRGSNPVAGKLNRPGDLHSQRLRIVCRSCNQGWMSLLQQTAKPPLSALLKSGWISLSDEDQGILAAWAAMFTMVYEFADPLTAAVPEQHRQHLMRNGTVPQNWTIWIGRAEISDEHPAAANHIGAFGVCPTGTGDLAPFFFQSTGFTVGTIFFQTLMLTKPGLCPNAGMIAERFDLRRLHPKGQSIGDAPRKLSRGSFFAVSNAFAQALGIQTFESV